MLVLLVDDDRAVRDALERALQLHGYEVALASDGDSALAEVEARTPDALVLDVMMPGLDGLDVTRRLRRQGNRVPILLLTARDAVGDRVEGLDAGADDYLPKPYDLEELLARLRALLRRSKPETPGDVLRFADLTLDLGSMDARRVGPPLRADDDRGAPPRALPAQPAAGASALADLRAGLGLRLQPLVERARRLRRLPPPQDGGGRGAAPDPHRARHGLRHARAMTLRGRLTLVAAGVVAVVVAVASCDVLRHAPRALRAGGQQLTSDARMRRQPGSNSAAPKASAGRSRRDLRLRRSPAATERLGSLRLMRCAMSLRPKSDTFFRDARSQGTSTTLGREIVAPIYNHAGQVVGVAVVVRYLDESIATLDRLRLILLLVVARRRRSPPRLAAASSRARRWLPCAG